MVESVLYSKYNPAANKYVVLVFCDWLNNKCSGAGNLCFVNYKPPRQKKTGVPYFTDYKTNFFFEKLPPKFRCVLYSKLL